MEKTKRIGSKTAAFIVVATILAIAAQLVGLNGIPLLMKGWPVFLIILGIEFWLTPQNSDRKINLAWGKLILAAIVSLSALFSFQSWIWFAKDTSFPFWSRFSSVEHRDLSPIQFSLSSTTQTIKLRNTNGKAEFIPDDREDVKIEAEIGELGDFFSRGKTFPEKDVKINVDERNETLLIEVEAKRQQMWFFRTTPSVNLKIFVPENHPLNYDISQRNGSIHAHDIPIRQHFEASTTNGRVEVSDLTGNLKLGSTNGSIQGRSLTGNVRASTTNGKINIDGDLEKVDVKTTNGKIEVASDVVKDDWDISTTNAAIELTLPKDADAVLSGKTTNGSVKVDSPIDVDGKRAQGTLGSGLYNIEFKTTNGGIAVNLQ